MDWSMDNIVLSQEKSGSGVSDFQSCGSAPASSASKLNNPSTFSR
jgi:hypothetical protein